LADAQIQNPSAWLGILNRLGIPRFGTWRLLDTVQPVALVDSEITLNASASTPLVNVPASAGELTAPAANTRLANTGALGAGPYTMVFWVGVPEANTVRIRRRNAADTADVWAHRWPLLGSSPLIFAVRLQLALNELVVVENITAGTAGAVYQCSVFVNAG
jgi:hypothetical protein